MNITIALGTRPEIIKLAPVVHELRARGHSLHTIATGQHYDAELSSTFFDSLGFVPDEQWQLPGGDAERTGALFTAALAAIAAKPPDLALVLGDTLTVPALCFAARRHRVPVAHVEAGLRSFNPTSLEEVNRRIAAATATLHLAPTALAAHFLRQEGVADDHIRVVGNPVLDVLRQRGITARAPGVRKGILFTAHRATNVDDVERLRSLVELVGSLARELPPVHFPVHPRTRARLEAAGLWEALLSSGATITAPLPFESLVEILRSVRVVVTDSGGLQEEASWLGIPTIVLRRSTPRWEGVKQGSAVLCGVDPGTVLDHARAFASPEAQARIAGLDCPYGDGHAAERIADVLDEPGIEGLLAISEPDFVGAELPW